LAAERGAFDFADVADGISDKLVRRHPHVFKADEKLSAREVLSRWEKLKLREKKGRPGVLDGVPRALPALLCAYRIQEKAAGVGFDWPDVAGVESKLREETDEFHRALARRDRRAQTEELGDLLFTLVNLARHLGVDPETALHTANEKFRARFVRMERRLRAQGEALGEADLDTMEAAWQASKRRAAPGRSGARKLRRSP
jgi:MazG family protein